MTKANFSATSIESSVLHLRTALSMPRPLCNPRKSPCFTPAGGAHVPTIGAPGLSWGPNEDRSPDRNRNHPTRRRLDPAGPARQGGGSERHGRSLPHLLE